MTHRTQSRQFVITLLASVAAITIGLWALQATATLTIGLTELVALGITFGLICIVVRRSLTLSRRSHGAEPVTIATWVTLGRACVLVIFTGLATAVIVADANQWVAAGLFAFGALFDAVDGAIARRTGSVTELGTRLDTEIDAVFVLVGAITVVALGNAPIAFLGVGVARYAFVGGIELRRHWGRPINELDPSRFRKATGATIMGTILVALAPIPGATVSWVIAAVVTVPILGHFLWDWLVVSGRID